MGDESGYSRFKEAGASQKAHVASILAEEGGLLVKNYNSTLYPVTGEAEKTYWYLLCGNQEKYKDMMDNHERGGKSNRGRRQSYGRHSRSRDNDYSNRPNKAHKV